jgi:hypothetical protein
MIVKVDIIIFRGNGFEETKETQQLRTKTSNSTDTLYVVSLVLCVCVCVREREREPTVSLMSARVWER